MHVNSCVTGLVNSTTTFNTCLMTTPTSSTSNSADDQWKDKAWTYFEMARAFPNRAGKLRQVLETQKRLALKLSSKRNLSDDAKALLISVAEGYDVGVELLEWVHQRFQQVVSDSKVLIESARAIQVLQEQGELISKLWDEEMKRLKEYQEENRKRL